MEGVWLVILLVVVFVAVALGVIGLVASWTRPQGGFMDWCKESFAAWRNDRHAAAGYDIEPVDTPLVDLFDSFEQYEGPAYLSGEELNSNFIDIKASPNTQKVVVTAEEMILKVQDISAKASRAVKRQGHSVKSVYAAPASVKTPRSSSTNSAA